MRITWWAQLFPFVCEAGGWGGGRSGGAPAARAPAGTEKGWALPPPALRSAGLLLGPGGRGT